MGKYQNFTLKEFIESSTARKKKIDNTPDFEHVEHLDELVRVILQPLRQAWGRPMVITSGYRCPSLNKAVGGVLNSAHLSGYAADVTTTGRLEDFVRYAERWMVDHDVKWDQSITETSGGSKWWHIAVRGAGGQQRCEAFSLVK